MDQQLELVTALRFQPLSISAAGSQAITLFPEDIIEVVSGPDGEGAIIRQRLRRGGQVDWHLPHSVAQVRQTIEQCRLLNLRVAQVLQQLESSNAVKPPPQTNKTDPGPVVRLPPPIRRSTSSFSSST
ncbi:MAG: hypothetical protein HJJLKODD_01726 [Phycisphaerae bacterium]|nr:hypothetical protein [Phycisphaerae bacterium]